MQVVHIHGSPRKNGNSATLGQEVCDRLVAGGATVTNYHLNSLDYQGCQGCEACKTVSESCVLEDDLHPVLQAIQEADVVILSTPVYWGGVTSQLKGCIDRFYSFLKPGFMQGGETHRLSSGKQLIFIQVQGAPDEGQFAEIYPRYLFFFQQLQFFAVTHLIRGCGLNNHDDAAAHPQLLQRARDVADAVLDRWNFKPKSVS